MLMLPILQLPVTREAWRQKIDEIAELYDYNFRTFFIEFLHFGNVLIYGWITYGCWVEQNRRFPEPPHHLEGVHPLWGVLLLTIVSHVVGYFLMRRMFR